MASVIVTLKIMPKGPETDLNKIKEEASKLIREFVDEKHKDGQIKEEIESIGFGLKALKLLFVMDENIGSTDKLEEKIRQLNDVESAETTDVRRAIG